METWDHIVFQVSSQLDQLDEDGCSDPFFRGHSEASWQLLPELARLSLNETTEDRLFSIFRASGSHLMPANATSWDILFLMRHHLIPTRLLDWSESFSVALYFAVKGCSSDAAIWILNPYKLNLDAFREEDVKNLNDDFPAGYHNYFINKESKEFGSFPASVMAVEGSRIIARMQWQRSVFTLHKDLSKPLEQAFPDALFRITIPQHLIPETKKFLRLAGMNEFSAFPDLDGLARHLRETELPTQKEPDI